ncbi:MAG: NAD-dependent epimerase/dehydratase family protein [Candidatus Aminicenantia bacterium]
MKAFIIGGTGFIGSHLVEYLLEKRFKVSVLIRNPKNLKWLSPLRDKINILKGDLFSIPEIPSDIDYVFHLAGLTKSRKIKDYYTVNQYGTASLFHSLSAQKISPKKFIYLSTLAAVGPSEINSPSQEENTPHPVSHYGKSKLLGEKEALTYRKKFPIVILRPPGIYGPRDRDFLFVFKIINQGFFLVFGRRKRFMNVCFVKDLITGMFLAAQAKTESGEIFNIADSKIYSWEEFFLLIAKIMGKKLRKIIIPLPLVYLIAIGSEMVSLINHQESILTLDKVNELKQSAWTCSVKKAREILSFESHFSLEEGLRETISWYKENNWL